MFDSKSYVALHPGMAERRINPLSHFFVFGPADNVAASAEPSPGKAGEISEPIPIKIVNRAEPLRTTGLAVDAPAPVASPKILLAAFDDDRDTIKGIRDFLRFAWGAVRRAVPDVELIIAGSAGGSFRSTDRQIRILDEDEPLDALYGQVRVAVNPSLAADRLSTLAALAHHRYVVSWPGGVDGLNPTLLSFCRVARNWVEFACATVSLLTSSEVPLADVAEREALKNALQAEASYG
jgi:hypothetical protein